MKTHHYIISFDPKDAVENGLTMERAQALGLQFCKDNFPTHPAIVCTHPDGHNSTGKHPRPHRDRQHPNTRGGAQALYAEAP
nr:relaxase/mobilization nuclease domain-containing protein [Faecalibacterium prausnitzii]